MSRISEAAKAILADGKAHPAREIADHIAEAEGTTPQAVRTELARMARNGTATRVSRGVYKAGSETPAVHETHLFARRLEAAMIERNMSSADLGAMLGVSRQTVNRWKNGEQEPFFMRVLEIAKAVRKPVSWFLPEARSEAPLLTVEHGGETVLRLRVTSATKITVTP